VAAAVAKTPAGCEAVVLGCTEYELVGDQIRQALPGVVTFGSAAAVAAQALRRIPGGLDPLPVGTASGSVRVLLSGRPAGLPTAALLYPQGRLLAPLVVPADLTEPVAGAVAGD
jgi:glutamate racemase